MASKTKFNLKQTTPPDGVKKNECKEQTKKYVSIIQEEQHKLYAEHKRSLLIVIQGMDASGKDGAIKQIFSSVNPQGVSVSCFKKPSELESAHDFLWRIHMQFPAKGMIKIFNRSHYEDILVPRVNGALSDKKIEQRIEIINSLEKYLESEGIHVIKIFLNVSKEEQKIRLEERLTNKLKQWKYNSNDYATRKDWDKYMEVYDKIFKECNQVPWNIIPSDKNWYKEYLISKLVSESLKEMKLKLPTLEEVTE